MRIRTVLLTGLLGVFVLASGETAAARDVEDMAVSAEEPVSEKTYDPIVGQNTSLLHTPSECRSATYCDVIDLEIGVPDGFGENDFHKVVVTLTWEDLSDDADLDLYLYAPDGSRHDESATGDPEGEQAQFTQPTEDTWFIVVNNFAGVHQSYTVKAEFKHEELQPIPELVLPTAAPGTAESTPTPPPARPIGDTPGSSSADDRPETTDATPEPVFTPGPDGPVREVALSSVPGSARPIEEGGWGWVLPVGVLVGIIGLGAGAYVMWRRLQDAA